MIDKLAILLITYHTQELTDNLVNQLNFYDKNLFDLTVIDNTHNNLGFDQVAVKWIQKNPGYLGYWLLNNDCILNPKQNYIEKFIDWIKVDNKIGIISTKINDSEAGLIPQTSDRKIPSLVQYVDFQSSVLTKSFINKYDLNIPYFFGGFDLDACIFANKNNFKILIDYTLEIKHLGGQSCKKQTPIEDLKFHVKTLNVGIEFTDDEINFQKINEDLIVYGLSNRYEIINNFDDCVKIKNEYFNSPAINYAEQNLKDANKLYGAGKYKEAMPLFKRAILAGNIESIPFFSTCIFNTYDYVEGAKFLSKYVDRTGYEIARQNYEFMVAQGDHYFTNVKEKYTIAMYVKPDAGHPWDPAHTDEGVGGSEIAVINMSKELVKLGHKVVIFNRCASPGIHDGATWMDLASFDEYEKSNHIDFLIVSRLPEFRFVNPKTKVLYWAHDLNYYERITPTNWQYFDKFLILSRYHYRFFSEAYPWIPTDFYDILPNGLDLTRFEQSVERNPKKLIYSSNPDRGLTILIDMFEKLHEWDPELELHVFGYYPENVRKHPKYWRDIPGLIYRGYHNQKDLAKEYMSSKLWLYPCTWLETFCITAIEAQAAGTPCIVSEWGPLRERIGNAGIVIDGFQKDLNHKEHFIQAVKDLLSNEDRWNEYSKKGIEQAKNFTWENSAKDLIKICKQCRY